MSGRIQAPSVLIHFGQQVGMRQTGSQKKKIGNAEEKFRKKFSVEQ
jgi:hypothetical protein